MDTQIITISSGKGPTECCWVVAQVLKQILNEVRERGYTYSIIDEQKGDQRGTYQSVSLSIIGNTVLDWSKTWNGTIQWIGTSIYRKHHKRKNWYVAVSTRNDMTNTEFSMNQLRIQTMRSGGKGGQHVNKVNTAVRVVHIPTGISAKSSDQRSQLQNKKTAIAKLQLKLMERKEFEAGKQANYEWQEKIEIERGNPIKIFTSTSFKLTKKKQVKNYGSERQELKQTLKKEMYE
ncbi:MAG: peptide chain release factor H [Flavobacteriales bacterium]|nr:peptide chain release factor H [Flavobacteriales bacterium]